MATLEQAAFSLPSILGAPVAITTSGPLLFPQPCHRASSFSVGVLVYGLERL